MSRSANDPDSETDPGWENARTQLFSMIMEGRSFSGRERNCFFLNTHADRFATISALSGFDFPDDGRGLAIVDWDRDGDQDLIVSNRNAPRLRLLRNDAMTSHHFIQLALEGDGETSNRDGIGARVVVTTSGQDDSTQPDRFVQTLQAGEGFLSQSSKWLHFGLSDSTKIEQVEVRWPGGAPQVYRDLDLNCRYRLVQGGAATKVEPSTIQLPPPSTIALPAPTRVARVVLETRVPMPTVRFQNAQSSANNSVEEFNFDSGKVTLVNLWASWCSPCVAELAEMTAKQKELENAGVRVLALSVDKLGSTPTNEREVLGLVEKLALPFSWGFLNEQQMQFLQDMHDQFFFLRKSLPLPSSFLIDAEGRLAIIYRGPVSVEQILEDVTGKVLGSNLSHEQLAQMAARFPGRVLTASRAREVAETTALQRRYRVADWLQDSQQRTDAIRHFELLVDDKPEWALIRRHLAKLYLDLNRINQAESAIVKAIELAPKNARAQNTLGLVLSRKGQVKQAEAQFRKAIALDEKLAGAHNNLGIALAMQGAINEAGKRFYRAIQLDGEFAKAHANLANVYAARGDANRAVRHYQLAIRFDPTDIEPYNNLGTMYGRMGQIAKAVQCYRHVLKINPQHKGAQRNLDRALRLLETQRQTSP